MTTKADLVQQLLENFSREELMQLVKQAEKRKREAEVDWTLVRHTCPKCGFEGFVVAENPEDNSFGVVKKRGVERAQSWCKRCRAQTNYYKRPRKNRVR